MKHLFLILAVLALVGLAGCRNQSVPEATELFCASLQAFSDSVKQLEQISADTTVGDARQISQDIDRSWQEVERAARDVADAKTDAVAASRNDLQRTIDSISGRDTLAEAAASVSASAAEVRAAVADLGGVTCPDWTLTAEADGATTAEAVAATPPAATEAAVSPPAPPAFAGIYTGQIPPSNGSAQAMTLTLHPGSAASMVFSAESADEDSGQAANDVILEGTWTANDDGTVSVTLDRLPDGTQLAIAESLRFVAQDGQLVAVEYDVEIYGPSGLTLSPVTTTAAALEASAVAAPTTAVITGTIDTAMIEAGPAGETSLTGTVWQLQQIQQGGAGVTTVADPSQYTLLLFDHGTVKATAECNSGAGIYQIDGSNVVLQIAWSAASCPQTSLARQYTKYLEYANAFQLQGSLLLIDYSSSSGRMTFAAAGQ
jgi:heat shock protein HslJ